MKGLLLKDVYIVLKETKYFMLVVVIVLLSQNDFLSSYIIVYAAMLPMTALAYDERAKWDKMEEMLPLDVDQIVGSKYIMGYLSAAAAIALVFLGKLIGRSLRFDELGMLLVVVCIALTVQALNLPLMFWIGVERGRLLFILLAISAAFAASSVWEEIAADTFSRNFQPLCLAAVGIAAAINILSFFVSKSLYHKKR